LPVVKGSFSVWSYRVILFCRTYAENKLELNLEVEMRGVDFFFCIDELRDGTSSSKKVRSIFLYSDRDEIPSMYSMR